MRKQGERGWPVHAKVMACVVMLVVGAAVIEMIELASPGNGWAHWRFWGSLVAVVYWPAAWYVIARHYGDERSTAEFARQDKQAKVRDRRIWRYLLPVIALFLLALGATEVGPAWRAAHGGGRTGTLTLRSHDCGGSNCAWRGDFLSDDGRIWRYDVPMQDHLPSDVAAGDVVRARDTGDSGGVFAAEHSNTWRLYMFSTIMGGVLLAAWLGWLATVVLRRLGPRRRPASPARPRGRPVEIPGDLRDQ